MSTVAVVVGNPKPRSRTLAAALHVATQLAGRDPDLVLDLADVGPRLLDPHDASVSELVADVGAAGLAVFASPTYKGSYTGLLKLFLDRFPADCLRGVAVALMVGAGPGHALAPEHSLRPVLTEIGGTVPFPGLFVLESAYDDPAAYQPWLDRARAVTERLATHLTARREVPA